MKKFATLTVVFLCIFQAAIFAQGLIKVKVSDEQSLNLPGAQITLLNSKHKAFTNEEGIAFLNQIPDGNYTLLITYIGFEKKELAINLKQGKTIDMHISLQSGVKTLKGIMVLGDRLRGQSKALNQQKNSDKITNIISSDQIGRFPDANIGDAIKRVPGITMQNDQGEARNIVVRGMGPEFNSVTLNGERIPSAEGDNRRVQMDLIPTDMIQTVEVNKTLTADMDADAIGGSINLVTRSAPNKLRVSTTLAGGYNPIRKAFIGNGSFVAGQRFGKLKQWGAVVSGSINSNDFGSDNVEALWAKEANGKIYIADHDIRVYNVKRVRRSLSSSFDWKINAHHTITLTGAYNWRDDLENRYRLRHRARGNDNNLLYGSDGEIMGYTNGEVLRQTKGGIDNDKNENRRLEDQLIRSLAIKGDHHLGSLTADWSVQYAYASETRPNERYISMGRRNITVYQHILDPNFPGLTDNTALNNYTRFNELTEQFQLQFEEDLNAKLNFSLPLSLIKNQTGKLDFGGRFRSKLKVRDNSFFSYEPIDDNEDAFANISLLGLIDKTNSRFYPGAKYQAGSFIDAAFLGKLDLNNPQLFEKNDEPAEYLATNFLAREQITAGYIQFRQQITHKFSAIAGLRIENTRLNYTGNIVEDEDDLKGQVNIKNNYTNLLPSLNLRYQAMDELIFKAAFTTSIARPRYYDLVPYFNLNPNDQELSTGNANLNPVKAINFDLMVEKYFKSVGIISGGVFYKKLDNFFYRFRNDNYSRNQFSADFPNVTNPIMEGNRWVFTQPRNGSGAQLLGVELALQRQLDFLPGIWKGLGVYLNYTYTYSKTEGIYDAEGNIIRSNVKLPGAAPHIFNASCSYENKKIVVRVSGNFTASYVDDSDDAGYSSDAFFDRYYDNQFFLDVNASYAITPRLRIFGEANNLTNQPLRYYQGQKNRTAQLEYYGPRFLGGLKFDLF